MSALSILTFNIRFGSANDGTNAWDKRKTILYRLIDKISPDILCLQEAEHFQILDILANVKCAKYEYIGQGRNGGTYGEHTPILYNTSRVAPNQNGTFWLTDADSTRAGLPAWGANLPRISTWASFRLHNGPSDPFLVLNTHLDNESVNAREQSAEMIVNRITNTSSEPYSVAFVTGDFNNLSSTAKELQTFRNAGFVDTFEATMNRPTETGQLSFGTFHGFLGRAYSSIPKIDFIWMKHMKDGRAGGEVKEVGIVRDGEQGRWPSDHFPVYAIVELARS
ncbi:hypothetical protein HDV00_005523 [Rhizophlyctis rosea]|nr:hypothetical protein HDV00_005523 [Rhizophlyctis rosea]